MVDKPSAIFILGMHRSGTSALARLCGLLGAEMPKRPLDANEFNPKGYWEPLSVVELNDALLEEASSAWDAPPASPDEVAKAARSARERAMKALSDEFPSDRLIAVKDPRCTVMADVWLDAAHEAGYEPKIAGIWRESASVVRSLQRREPFDADEAALLWANYNVRLIEALRRYGGALISYRELTADWRSAAMSIARHCKIDWPKSLEAAGPDADKFISAGRDVEALDLPEDVRAVVGEIERALGGGGEGVNLSKAAAAIAAKSKPFRSTVRRITDREARRLNTIKEERDQAREAHAAADGQLAAAVARASELERERTEARKAHAVAETRLVAERDKAREAHAAAETRLIAERDKARSDHHALELEFQELERAAMAYRKRGEALELELAQTQHDYRSADAERNALRLERDRVKAHLDLIRQHAVMRALRAFRRLVNRVPGLTLIKKPIHRFVVGGLEAAIKLVETAGTQSSKPRGAVADRSPQADGANLDALSSFIKLVYSDFEARRIAAIIRKYGLTFQSEDSRPVELEVSARQARSWAKGLAGMMKRRSSSTVDEPDVSIIVPAFNQVAYTLACIESLITLEDAVRFELVIGDDCSTDATQAASEINIPGVRWVRHSENLGFVGNCNRAASFAQGRYVVFLNNDTLVLSEWLSQILETFKIDESVGLVGSKLIYPDGRLQEAGGLFWRDGSAWNYGRLDDPRRPEYSYAREVDYISGASIALKKGLWEQLQGFDEAYKPAYVEDADLAFRVRSAGLKCMLQPRSVAVHFEGVTSGTDIRAGAKAHQTRNLITFRERWSSVLSAHRENGVAPELEKERGVSKRALFVDLTTPEPEHDAGSLVAFQTMRAMQHEGMKVTFVPQDNFLWMPRFTPRLQSIGIEAIYAPYYLKFSDFIKKRGDEFDLIILHRFQVVEQTLADIRTFAPQAAVAFLNADLHYLREEREARVHNDLEKGAAAAKTKARELAVVRAVDFTLSHSIAELEILRSEAPDAPLMLLPLTQEAEPTTQEFDERHGVGFLGGFNHPPNLHAVEFFIREVWPFVKEQYPDESFFIAGSHIPRSIRKLDGVDGIQILGFVKNLDDFFGRVKATVAPLRFGAGIKGKVIASLAHGVPCIGTSIASEGTFLTPGENFVLADDADAMARETIDLLKDRHRWRRLREAGLDYVAQHASTSALQQATRQLIVRSENRPGSPVEEVAPKEGV